MRNRPCKHSPIAYINIKNLNSCKKLKNYRVTSGDENVLYYYVEIESGEGMILAPPSTHPINVILFAFQKASLLIHSILQNSIRYNNQFFFALFAMSNEF